MGWQRGYLDRTFAIAPVGGFVDRGLQSFKEFPPRRKPGGFNHRACDGGRDPLRGRQVASGPPARG